MQIESVIDQVIKLIKLRQYLSSKNDNNQTTNQTKLWKVIARCYFLLFRVTIISYPAYISYFLVIKLLTVIVKAAKFFNFFQNILTEFAQQKMVSNAIFPLLGPDIQLKVVFHRCREYRRTSFLLIK